jgi:hypothetical protein
MLQSIGDRRESACERSFLSLLGDVVGETRAGGKVIVVMMLMSVAFALLMMMVLLSFC